MTNETVRLGSEMDSVIEEHSRLGDERGVLWRGRLQSKCGCIKKAEGANSNEMTIYHLCNECSILDSATGHQSHLHLKHNMMSVQLFE